MKIKDKLIKTLDKKFGNFSIYKSFRDDYGFRTILMTLFGSFINIIFAIFNGVTAIIYKSQWYGAFAFYYLTLALQRIFIFVSYKIAKRKCGDNQQKFEREKYKIYLANGVVFVLLDIALGVLITLMVLMQKPTIVGEIMAITTATFTFYRLTLAIINLVKAKSKKDTIIQAIQNIGFVDALASIISLETTLISTFGEFDYSMRVIMALSGLFVVLFTIGLGVFMVIKAIKKLKDSKPNS